MRLKTFSYGGIHPDENKLSTNKEIELFPVPEKVLIPLAQNLGAPSKPLVKKGDKVKVGTKIAEAGGFISSNLHSSVSGTVTKIDNFLDATGYKRPAIEITTEGDEWEESIDQSISLEKEIKLDRQEIIAKIKEAGIVGLGGATFPSHVKLMIPEGKQADTLLINGVECEPYLTCDHRVMLERSEELMVGVSILMKGLDVTRAIIGVENNKPDAIAELKTFSVQYPRIEIEALKVQYPQGGEKQLIDALLKREVPPPPGLPIDVGVVVFNVQTVIAVYEAIQKNKPLFERVLTVTGKSVKKPSNFQVRIGSSTASIIEAAGGVPDDTGKIVNGGPMTGKSLTTNDVPVTKGCSGILLIKDSHTNRRPESSCIRCAKCVSVCPIKLESHLLANLSRNLMWDKAENANIMDCMKCGSCSYICPANVPILDFIVVGQIEVGKIIRARNK